MAISKFKIWVSLLLVVLIAGMPCACASPASEVPSSFDNSSASTESIEEVPATSTLADRVEVVYFHRPQRCSSCIYAESGVRYTVITYFADELASGEVSLKVVTVGGETVSSAAEKYGAFTSSLFINAIKDRTDHIEEVNGIWLVMGDDEAFVDLVKSKIEKSLAEVR